MFAYCPEFTKTSHLAPTYLTDLNAICYRDYEESLFQSSIICLDLDKYETACAGENDATMDAATGIADYNNNRISFPRHLLVELRLGYESLSSIDLSKMKQKVVHSRDILSPEPVNERVVFIFKSRVAPLARNRFSRLSLQDKELRNWDIMCIEEFSGYIRDISEFPYVPENNLDSIRTNLNSKYLSGGLNEIDKMLSYWKNRIEKYKLHYKNEECKAIANVIIAFLKNIQVNQGSFEEEVVKYWLEIFSNV